MSKILKAVLVIVLAVAVVAAGVGVGYLIKEKGLMNSTDQLITEQQQHTDAVNTVDVEKIYKDYLDSAEAEKYYHILEDDGDEGFKYSGKKRS